MNAMKQTLFKVIFFSIFIYILAFTNTYFSLSKFSDTISSGCLDCSFNSEVLRYCLIVLFLIPLLLIIERMNSSIKLKKIILVTFFCFLLYLINLILFDFRVASWETYSELEILISVLFNSLMLPVSATLFFLYLKYIYFK
ncbi:hypothetical protein BWK59_10145 [Flavobacterium davisii]|uniref:Uncharacterized protein n=1 Tax=Flavobacterium davisii TaxID=2906077 RepID=A0A246GH59_9FLAO|nr:hypothetical protein BWK59_10145 [Flavobacterium davisii]